jgi:hypothetical protein
LNRHGVFRRGFVGIRRLRRAVLLASPLALLLILAAAGGASAADGPGLGDATQVLPGLPPVDPATTPAPIATGLTAIGDGAVASGRQAVPVETQKSVVETVRKAGAEPASVVGPVVPVAVPPSILADPLGGFGRTGHAGTPRRPEARAGAAAIAPAAVAPDRLSVIVGDQPAAAPSIAQVRSFEATAVLGPTQPSLPVAPASAASDAAIGAFGTGPGPWLALMLLPLVGVAWRSIVRVMALFRIPPGMTPRFAVPPG